VEELCQGVFVHLVEVSLIRDRASEKVLISLASGPARRRFSVEHEERVYRRQLLAERLDQARKLVFEQQHLGLRVVQNIRQLPGSELYVEGKKHASGCEHAVIPSEQAVTVGAQVGNAIARLNTQVAHSPGQASGTAREFRVGQAQPAADNRGLAGVLLARIAQEA